MFTQKFIKIFHSIQEIGPFSLFQNLALGKASTDDTYVILQFLRLDLGNINVSAKFGKIGPRPIKNDISQSLGLDLVNINVYADVYKNIPFSSRDKVIFTFSEFGIRQSLDR